MSRSRDCGRRCRLAWLVAALCLAPLASPAARAADIETRDFAVLVGSKPAGEVHMTIHKQKDGSVLMRCDTDIKVKIGLIEYKFIYRGLEVWKDHRLTKFTSTTDDNGKKSYRVTAEPVANGLKVTVNNVEKTVPANVWLTSYWSLPDPKLRDGDVFILDADDGKELSGKLQFVATEKIKVAGQLIPLNHYRITGKVNMDLWYDGSDRLVRQEWVEQGYKTLVELVRVRK